MKGIDVKTELKRRGFTLTQVAGLIGESQQNLNALLSKDDIRTSLVERIAEATGLPVSLFYGDTNIATASGENSSAVAGNNNRVNMKPDKFLEELAAQRRLTEKAMEQNSDLLGILKNLTGAQK